MNLSQFLRELGILTLVGVPAAAEDYGILGETVVYAYSHRELIQLSNSTLIEISIVNLALFMLYDLIFFWKVAFIYV